MKVTIKELRLALQRLSTGRNIPYKRFFRSIYLNYQFAADDNLKRLRQEIQGNWKASKPLRIYTPKPSGLQRPITLLKIDDQIILQLLANRLALKIYKRRKKVEHKVAFSNILSRPKDSVFFLEDWHLTYSLFQKKCEEHYKNGFHWIAHFDLAAYYDTLSHEILMKVVAPRTSTNEPWTTYMKWLQAWSSPVGTDGHAHGIPQGPIGADFLGEIFLLPLDEKFLKEGIRYVRYVDDIRIFAETELDAQKAAVELEVFCRNHGLIPQGKKFAIKKAEKLDDALGTLPSIRPTDIAPDEETPQMEKENAEKLFDEALSGRPIRIEEKSKVRYVLFRAPKSRRILKKCIKLLSRHPEHIDAFVSFFRNFEKSIPLEREILRILDYGTPYGYIKGELYQVIARIGSDNALQILMPNAKVDLSNKSACVILKWGAFSLLLACQKKGFCRIVNRIKRADPIVQALLLPVIPETEYNPNGLIETLLSSPDYTAGILIPEQLFRRSQTLRDYVLHPRNCSTVVQNTLKAMGIVGRRYSSKIDQIADILNRQFIINNKPVWRKLLATEFMHALKILVQAEIVYLPSPSNWLQLQNSFNDAIQKALLEYLSARTLPGSGKTMDRKGELIKFGVRLDPTCPFSTVHSTIADIFRDMNARRNRLPGSHPYDKRTTSQTNFLKAQERNKYLSRLRIAYNAIIHIIDTNP
jgi:hypothetical protein